MSPTAWGLETKYDSQVERTTLPCCAEVGHSSILTLKALGDTVVPWCVKDWQLERYQGTFIPDKGISAHCGMVVPFNAVKGA